MTGDTWLDHLDYTPGYRGRVLTWFRDQGINPEDVSAQSIRVRDRHVRFQRFMRDDNGHHLPIEDGGIGYGPGYAKHPPEEIPANGWPMPDGSEL